MMGHYWAIILNSNRKAGVLSSLMFWDSYRSVLAHILVLAAYAILFNSAVWTGSMNVLRGFGG